MTAAAGLRRLDPSAIKFTHQPNSLRNSQTDRQTDIILPLNNTCVRVIKDTDRTAYQTSSAFCAGKHSGRGRQCVAGENC